MVKGPMLQLENLITGKSSSIELKVTNSSISRDLIVERINSMLEKMLPGCWMEGQFVDKEDCDYVVYELHMTGSNKGNQPSSIRIFEFSDMFRLTRI